MQRQGSEESDNRVQQTTVRRQRVRPLQRRAQTPEQRAEIIPEQAQQLCADHMEEDPRYEDIYIIIANKLSLLLQNIYKCAIHRSTLEGSLRLGHRA